MDFEAGEGGYIGLDFFRRAIESGEAVFHTSEQRGWGGFAGKGGVEGLFEFGVGFNHRGPHFNCGPSSAGLLVQDPSQLFAQQEQGAPEVTLDGVDGHAERAGNIID